MPPPADLCDSCGRSLAADEPRQRCSDERCDELRRCRACAGERCPRCGGDDSLFVDEASPLALRRRVFAEAFATKAGASEAVDPRLLVARAFAAYAGRPLLGEPRADGSVRWWSYGRCGAAARALGDEVRRRCGGGGAAVVICASNSAGWLLADWACALVARPRCGFRSTSPRISPHHEA